MSKKLYQKFLKHLLNDLRPASQGRSFGWEISRINKEEIKDYCRRIGDMVAYQKMTFHQLLKEPIEQILVVNHKKQRSIGREHFNQLLKDFGYKINVFFSRTRGADYDAAVSVGGYSIPGWYYLVKFLRVFSRRAAVLLGKKIAPGRSRLHLRIYEGRKSLYILPHIDYNWLNWNIWAAVRAHMGAGKGDYKNGIRLFEESLKHYFDKLA